MSLHDINGSISIFAEKEIRCAVLDGKKQYATWKTLLPNAWTFLRRSFHGVAVVIADGTSLYTVNLRKPLRPQH